MVEHSAVVSYIKLTFLSFHAEAQKKDRGEG